MSRAVGVLGGAFNPPHIGHMLLAQEAIDSLGLDELLLVPTGEAPHKAIASDPGAGLRLRMAAAAAAGCERLAASDLEVRREGPSFSYRTLELLADELRGSQLTFVLGADAAAGLASWRRPERVLELARIAVATRPGWERSRVDAELARLGARETAQRLDMPPIGVSSSLVRERVAAGRSIRWLVPDAVAGIIREQRLYAVGA